jgi:hypothetical protein
MVRQSYASLLYWMGSGQVRSCQVRSCQVRSGQVMSCQVRSGQVRSYSYWQIYQYLWQHASHYVTPWRSGYATCTPVTWWPTDRYIGTAEQCKQANWNLYLTSAYWNSICRNNHTNARNSWKLVTASAQSISPLTEYCDGCQPADRETNICLLTEGCVAYNTLAMDSADGHGRLHTPKATACNLTTVNTKSVLSHFLPMYLKVFFTYSCKYVMKLC